MSRNKFPFLNRLDFGVHRLDLKKRGRQGEGEDTDIAIVLPISLFIVGIDLSQVTLSGYLALGWASIVGTLIGMFLEFYIIKRFSATTTAMTAYIIPIVAGIGGVLLLNETFTRGMLAGMALIIIGIATLHRAAPQKKLPEIEAV